MGVRGLTSYIARHAEQYLTPYELHDCNLVIDGDSLACKIYQNATGNCSAFGGDYDDFYHSVLKFFQVLEECNIEPYVIMDGGYEKKKLRTVGKRLRGKIAIIKRINPVGSAPVFPQMMKEVFIDAVRDSNVSVMRCVFEADNELATLSRKLGCPVLTYDSDFYIYNVLYIPSVTLTIKAHTKRLKENKAKCAQQEQPTRKLRKNEAKHVQKLTKSDHMLGGIQVNNVEKHAHIKGKTYKYLDCCIYRIENLITRRSLSKEKLPLFAAMLGNDYIASSSFRNFFTAGMGKAGRSRKLSQQQRRIRAVLDWLKKESLQTALNKIMSHLRLDQRASLLAQVNAATSGYSSELCHSFDYFLMHYKNAFQTYPPREFEEIDGEDSTSVQAIESDENLENEDIDDNHIYSNNDDNCVNDETAANENNAENIGQGSSDSTNEEDSADDASDNEDGLLDNTKLFPSWFLEKLYPAHLPRFLVNLIHLRKYINNPQIEHFPYNDCHEVALPILNFTFTLLNSVNGEIPPPQFDEDGAPMPIQFTYMTRATKVTNVRYIRYDMETVNKYNYNPSSPNGALIRHPFIGRFHGFDANKLFKKVELLPKDLQLYFLSIVYWLQKSQHCDLIHLHALLICLVTLRTVDANIPPVRNIKEFNRRFEKILKRERQVRYKESQQGIKRGISKKLTALQPVERINFVPKSDCFLVQQNLLKHFHMQEIFKKKYDQFSTKILHAFSELQSIVFQMYALNALLDCPYEPPKMGRLYSGIFLYNLYDLLKSRSDMIHYVENFLFCDSQVMFEFYTYLLEWCNMFVPTWKRENLKEVSQTIKKKRLRRRRKKTAKKCIDPNANMVDCENTAVEAGEFCDINNKFCTLLKI